MPIIDLAPTPPTVARANTFRGQIQRQFNELSRLGRDITQWIWADPTHTPQQAFDAFGTEAVDLLKVGDGFNALTEAYFGAGAPMINPPAGKDLTRNTDGTVTVSDAPPTS